MLLGNALLLFTALSLTLVLGLSPFTKKIKDNYWFWFVVGLFVFLYVMFGRQIQYLVQAFSDPLLMSSGIKLSRILLLDLCPFYGIFGSLSLMLKNKSVAKMLAPFGFFGAAVTLFGQVFFQANQIPTSLYWEYIFVGIAGNQLYFMMHFLSLILSFMIMCWIRGWNIKLFVYANLFAFFYFSYIVVVVRLNPEIVSNTTGVLENDWLPGGEYEGVGQFLNLTYPEVMIAGYGLSYVAISLMFWTNYGIDWLINKYGSKTSAKIKNTVFVQKCWAMMQRFKNKK